MAEKAKCVMAFGPTVHKNLKAMPGKAVTCSVMHE
jgi:hypothetical protein